MKKTFPKRVQRIVRTLGGVIRLLLHGRVRNSRLFITCNSQAGLLMTALLVRAGRALGYRLVLHHHSYRYIDRFDPRMNLISRMMTDKDIHLVHCPKMADDFRAKYNSHSQFAYLYPSIVSLPLEQPRPKAPETFRLGFLANLTLEKGLEAVLATHRALHKKGRNVHLCLAGPCRNADAQKLIDRALDEHKGFVEYLGAVYGGRKVQFFRSIDCFLFPTDTESWGIVLNEALASGVPVMTTNRGCIQTVMGNCGLVVDDVAEYVDQAVQQVEAWIDSPSEYAAASEAAVRQADFLHREAEYQLEELVSVICSP